MFLITPLKKLLSSIFLIFWDVSLNIGNLLTPKRRAGFVIPKGHPGFEGKWPEFIPPQDGDSRCSCPALNAMANHGILPRDGKNISFKELNKKVRETYNFGPSFCYFVPNFAADMLKRSYSKGTFNLKDLDLHNGIEHDASLTRQDVYFQPDQGKPDIPLVKELLASATGKDKDGNVLLTSEDLAKVSGKRRAAARDSNPEFTLATEHKMFGSSNSSTLLTIFGGRVKDLEPILLEERIPDGWEPRIRERLGLTILAFNKTVLGVETRTKEDTPASVAPTTNPESNAGGVAT
ncbi:Cloroperoxidase [Pluteus cervinus]|uniref:Cloroperoxidase n=1 Tax=Pluteus cervinus TaxID=181527 RepID=A0ACD3BCL2_9AGAR|nr:Cloroperoxidase [Pluteus cervinus]